MSNRSKKAKTSQLRAAAGNTKNSQHITKISASSSHRREDAPKPADLESELVVTDTGAVETRPAEKTELNQPKKLTRAEKKAARLARKNDEERPIKSYFLLFRPFVRLGRYLRDSWREIRQVRWPNRKTTWKLTLAVLVYSALFIVFLTLIDVFFTFIFDLLFKK